MTAKESLVVVFLVALIGLGIFLCIQMDSTSAIDMTAKAPAIAMMQKVPEDSDYFSFIDMREFQAVYVHEEYLDYLEIYTSLVGLTPDDIESLGTGDSIILFEGDFVFDQIRDSLEDSEFEHLDDYNGVEMWAEGDDEDRWFWIALRHPFPRQPECRRRVPA